MSFLKPVVGTVSTFTEAELSFFPNAEKGFEHINP